MKKFSVLLSAAVLTAVASPVSAAGLLKNASVTGENSRVALQAKDLHKRSFKKVETLNPEFTANPMKARKAASKVKAVAPVTQEPVTEVPSGTVSNWSRDCGGYLVFFGYVLYGEDAGGVVKMVDAGDNTVWLNNPLSQFPIDAWVKGVKDADGNISIASGQAVYQEFEEGETYTYYMCPLEYKEDEEGGWFYPTDADYKLVLKDGAYQAADPEVVFGICYYGDGEMSWVGYGDDNVVINAVTGEALELPAGLTSEKWAVTNGSEGYFANVAVDNANGKLYVGGLNQSLPDSYVVGDIKGETVVFAGAQFLGEDASKHWSYLYGGTVESVWDDFYEEYTDVPTVTGDLTYSYDAEGKKLATAQSVIFTSNTPADYADAAVSNYLKDYEIVYQQRNAEAKPTEPFGLYAEPFDAEYGYGMLEFNLGNVDVDGNLLDTNDLYYVIYMDGEEFTFYPDEYTELKEEMTLVPYNFTDNYDIYSDGTLKEVYFYVDGIDTLGVQAVYKQSAGADQEPVELRSDIVTFDLSSVKGIEGDNAGVKSTVYFDMQGRRISNPESGLYIRRDVLTNGKVKVTKSVVR